MLSKTQQRRAKLQAKKGIKTQKEDDDLAFLDKFREEVNASTATNTTPSTPAPTTETQNTSSSSSTSSAETSSTPAPTTTSSSAETSSSTTSPSDSGYVVPRNKIVEKATEIWKTLKLHVKKDASFKELENQDKLEVFRTKLGYATFMEEFPIVSRYMICYGQYSEKAFERMLRKIETVVHPPPDKRDKGYMEDQWVRRQADYVQYLWESYQKRHQNTAERQWIWQTTYDRLRKEFDDFRDMHKDVEERVKNERKTLAGQNARELLERVKSGKQQLTSEEEEFLLEQLRTVFDKKVNGIEDETQETTPDNSKILMIETVDTNRMNEIDDKYKFNEHKGMEPVLEETEETVVSEEVISETPVVSEDPNTTSFETRNAGKFEAD